MSDGTAWHCGRCGIGGLGLPVGHLCNGDWMLPTTTPTVSPEEHRRVQAEAAVARRALEAHLDASTLPCVCQLSTYEDTVCLRCEAERVASDLTCSALSSSAGSALLEEMEGLEREREELREERDAAQEARARHEQDYAAVCSKMRARMADWRIRMEKAEAESADLRARLERAEEELAAFKTEAARMLAEDADYEAAEVRRAVEAETERIVAVLRARAREWGADTAVGHALEVAAADIRSRS